MHGRNVSHSSFTVLKYMSEQRYRGEAGAGGLRSEEKAQVPLMSVKSNC